LTTIDNFPPGIKDSLQAWTMYFAGLHWKAPANVSPSHILRKADLHPSDATHQGWQTYGTRKYFLGTPHSLLSHKFYLFCVSILWRICVYIYKYLTAYKLHKNCRCYQTTLQVEHFYTNLDPFLAGYFSFRCRPDGDWANTWYWTKRFTIIFQKGSSSSPNYFHIVFLIAFFEQAFIRNVTIIIH